MEVPSDRPAFFSLTTAQIHSWTGLGGRGPGNVAPEKLPVFLDLPRSLVAPASRHKAPQSGLWLLLCHPVGTLKSRGLWSRRATQTAQNSTGHKSTGFVGLFLVTCFGETESHLRPAQNIGRGCWAIPAAPYHGVVRHPTTQNLLSPWPWRALTVVVSRL